LRSHLRLRRVLVPALAVAGLLGASTGALAQTGGSTAPGSTTTTPTTPTTPAPTTTPGVATLQADGSALAPPDAPRQVRKAINAANRIRFKPYLWGGGHRSFKAKGYDCSGAVSYVLHAAGLLKRPMPSGAFATSWGSPGVGQWITVYANKGHMYAVIAGLRWDTSAVGESLTSGSGPRWRSTQRTPTGYTSKYYLGL
jgi:hypothetical protein